MIEAIYILGFITACLIGWGILLFLLYLIIKGIPFLLSSRAYYFTHRNRNKGQNKNKNIKPADDVPSPSDCAVDSHDSIIKRAYRFWRYG